MKIKELKQLNSEELVQKEKDFKRELHDLNYQRKVGAVEKPSRIGSLKRSIARILTILRERELDNERKSK